MSPGSPVLAVEHLSKRFALAGGRALYAVNDVSFSIAPGEAVALVGESGSGKSTIGLLATRLIAPTAGRISFEGRDITRLHARALRPLRARLQIVFQNPWEALNPRMTIGRALAEPLVLHAGSSPTERRLQVFELADQVRLPRASLDRYPHELSGGQLQRVSIARALATRPRLIVLDEPTSSLDLSVRAGILQLLDGIRRTSGVALLFISHDLETVELVTDRVLVLYLGRIVESGPTRALFEEPAHPYTQALLSAALAPDPRVRSQRHVLAGEIPRPTAMPPGCGFASRCPLAIDRCRSIVPEDYPIESRQSDGRHVARCLRIPAGEHRLATPNDMTIGTTIAQSTHA